MTGDAGVPSARTVQADDHALLATVLDETHDCIKLLGSDGRIEFVNRRGAEAMELRAPEELIGQIWLDRWPEASRPKVAEALDLARAGDKARFHAMRPRPDGSASWWDVTIAPVRAADGLLTHFLVIARDATQEVIERERAQAISAEMRHRLKNALAIAGALVSMSARGKPEQAAFAAEVVERLARLSNVQAIILDSGASKKLAQIVPMLAAAYGDGAFEFGRVPDVDFDESAMQALALSFGELCTNSLKYGALANGMKVSVDAEVEPGLCTLIWSETTEFAPGRESGQGLTLIDRIVGAAGGRVVRTVKASNLTVRITLPTSGRQKGLSEGESS